jgi:predicted Zn-dependent protease
MRSKSLTMSHFVRAIAVLLLVTTSGFSAFAAPLVGTGVGNADTLLSEGSKLFNEKKYAKAAANFLAATRANPVNLNTYVQLARASSLENKLTRACYAYRVFLKASPDTPERKKASAESDQCERKLKVSKGQPPDLTQRYVEMRAAFFAALDKSELTGKDGALGQLEALVKEGFLGPDLGDMAQKLGAAAGAAADAIHTRALSNEKLSVEQLKAARPLYQMAADVGAPVESKGRMAYLDGLAALASKDFKKAEGLFEEASKSDAANGDYVYSRAVALYQVQDKQGALRVLEAQLKDDPRTGVLRTAIAHEKSAQDGAQELERLLFSARFATEK